MPQPVRLSVYYGQTLVAVSVAGSGGHIAVGMAAVQAVMVIVMDVVEIKVTVPELCISVGKNVLQLATLGPVNVPMSPSHHVWVKSIEIIIA